MTERDASTAETPFTFANQPFTFANRKVMITGASSGIGAALALELARAGATVGLCARRVDLLNGVLDRCREASPDSRAWPFDLADLDALDGFASRVNDELGGIDVLVNNAAQPFHGEALTTSAEDLEYVTRLDYLSPVRLTTTLVGSMLRRGRGRVVAISSMAARMSTPGEAAYAAAKAALSSFFEALAGELWDSPVRFHLVYPALIDLTPGRDGDDSLATRSDGTSPIPAAVAARAIRRQVEAGEFELYIPTTMAAAVAHRTADVARSVEFMGRWYRAGGVEGMEAST